VLDPAPGRRADLAIADGPVNPPPGNFRFRFKYAAEAQDDEGQAKKTPESRVS
jgi:hypothetical protein